MQTAMAATLTDRMATVRRSPSMSWPEARALAHRLARPLPAEVVPLARAARRTLAAPVLAAVGLPGFDNAAMDGYAVRGPGPWRVVGRVLAGRSAEEPLHDGQAVQIATGAPVPAGANRVIRVECSRRDGDLVEASADDRDHIRRAGEYVQAGQEVLAVGDALHPAALGLAASVGVDRVAVRRQVRVRILVTGDEVVAAGIPAPGLVRDAISPAVAALVGTGGGDVEDIRYVPDVPGALRRAIESAMSTVDVMLVCGACSVGPADHLHPVLADLGAMVQVDGVACRPGHPQVLAQLGSGWVAGLPGNPFAALVAAATVVQPLLAGLHGQALAELPRARLGSELAADEHRTRLVPVRWQADGVRIVAGARPGHLGAAAHADALAVVPPGPPAATVELLAIA
jgi:molybdopterin molybdotransferase